MYAYNYVTRKLAVKFNTIIVSGYQSLFPKLWSVQCNAG